MTHYLWNITFFIILQSYLFWCYFIRCLRIIIGSKVVKNGFEERNQFGLQSYETHKSLLYKMKFSLQLLLQNWISYFGLKCFWKAQISRFNLIEEIFKWSFKFNNYFEPIWSDLRKIALKSDQREGMWAWPSSQLSHLSTDGCPTSNTWLKPRNQQLIGLTIVVKLSRDLNAALFSNVF